MLLRSPLRVGAPEEPGSVLLRSIPGSELLRSQGPCSSGAGARGGSCQERPSPATHYAGVCAYVWLGSVWVWVGWQGGLIPLMACGCVCVWGGTFSDCV